jgi:hypothetical protein
MFCRGLNLLATPHESAIGPERNHVGRSLARNVPCHLCQHTAIRYNLLRPSMAGTAAFPSEARACQQFNNLRL